MTKQSKVRSGGTGKRYVVVDPKTINMPFAIFSCAYVFLNSPCARRVSRDW